MSIFKVMIWALTVYIPQSDSPTVRDAAQQSLFKGGIFQVPNGLQEKETKILFKSVAPFVFRHVISQSNHCLQSFVDMRMYRDFQ